VNFLFLNLFLFFTGISNPVMHPIHVSICNVDFSDSGNTVAIKLFKDDFALALKNNFQVDVPMEKADEPANRQIISKYVNDCLKIEMNNNKSLDLVFKSSEINEDAIWLYFKTDNKTITGNLKIKNTLMLDLWDDQTNLMIIGFKGQEKGYRFNRKDVEMNIDLNN